MHTHTHHMLNIHLELGGIPVLVVSNGIENVLVLINFMVLLLRHVFEWSQLLQLSM